MGYIIKSPTGGGGGDATAANQLTQIKQINPGGGDPSVFKDPTSDLSVFLDDTLNQSVFKDNLGDTVFISAGKTIADRVYESFNLLEGSIRTNAATTVTSFTSTTLAGVAALLETFLQANPNIYIINISFSSAGVTQHDVLLTYNP